MNPPVPTLQQIITPGNVLSLFCEFIKPYPKEKLLVLVAINPRLLFFLINSEINQYMEGKLYFSAAQLAITPADHSFLTHESWIDCYKVIYVIDANEIAHQMQSRLGRLAGAITSTVRQQIKALIRQSPTLEKRYIDSILADLPD